MNFFGHAVLASRERDDPAFVLGSMLPDFATMIRTRPPSSEHPLITAGIAYHHLTDEAFHDAPLFRSECQRAFEDLQRLGVRRGSARAVAHVGLELLIDDVLAADERARLSYARAIEQSADGGLGRFVAWPTRDVRARFQVLQAALERRGSTAHDDDPALVVVRLSRALAGRPRLELDQDAETLVHRWVVSARQIVKTVAEPLIAEVEQDIRAAERRRNGLVAPSQSGG